MADILQILSVSAQLLVDAGCLAQSGNVNCDGAQNAVDALDILRGVRSHEQM